MPDTLKLNRLLAGIVHPQCPAIPTPQRLARAMQEALIKQAIDQGVAVLCHEYLAASALAGRFDTDLLARLHSHAVAESALDAHRQQCLGEVCSALTRAGINALLFKGSALALSHYPHSHLRPRDDTDLLVPATHLAAVQRVLARLGFRRTTANQQSLIAHQRLYQRRDPNGCLHNLDVHWAINNRQEPNGWLGLASLRARATTVPALGGQALAPAPVDAVLIACVHLQVHHPGEIRLIWLYDIYLLVEAMTPAQHQALTMTIKRLGLAATCRLGLGLAAWYFAAPGSALAELVPVPLDPNALRAPRRLQFWLGDLATLPDSATRLRYLSQHLLPGPGYMLEQAGKVSALWLPWLYLRRAGRGLGHLLRR